MPRKKKSKLSKDVILIILFVIIMSAILLYLILSGACSEGVMCW